jgi:hypothetical protein
MDRPRADPSADPLQALHTRLYMVGGSVQGTTQEITEVLPLRWRAVVAGCHDYSCSRAARRAVMPRAVWLFTAPRLIFMAAAISASERSA